MAKAAVVGVLLTGAAVVVGFAVGFGIGQKTREAAESNVSADFKDGKVIVIADVANALSTGLTDYLGGLLG